jgi:hemerythrin superfamily protein
MMKQSIQRLGFFFRKLTQRKLDVLDQLEEDHIRVEMLFVQWRMGSSEARRRQIFDKIRQELSQHMHREESRFYPACSKISELKPLMSDAAEDHRQIKILLKEISDLPSMESERAKNKMRVLLKQVEDHVTEEENELFPRVKALMKKGQFNRLSREIRQIRERKQLKTTRRRKAA